MNIFFKTLLISSVTFFSNLGLAQAVLKSTDGKFDLHVEEIDGQAVKDNTSLQFPKNKLFAMQVRLVSKSFDSKAPIHLEFDASMPAHKHGMLTKAKASDKGGGRFRIEGIKLHMPGAWVLSFTIKQGKQSDSLNVHWNVK